MGDPAIRSQDDGRGKEGEEGKEGGKGRRRFSRRARRVRRAKRGRQGDFPAETQWRRGGEDGGEGSFPTGLAGYAGEDEKGQGLRMDPAIKSQDDGRGKEREEGKEGEDFPAVGIKFVLSGH